jgi:hypothetical protein
MNTTLEYSGKPLWYLQNDSDLLEADIDFGSLLKNQTDVSSSDIPEARYSREETPETLPNEDQEQTK